MGEALLNLGRTHAALPHLQRALVVRERIFAPDHEQRGYALYFLGRAELALGRVEAAVSSLEHSYRVLENKQGLPQDFALVRFHLARALWQSSGQHRARALELAREAHRTLVAGGTPFHKNRDDAATWLRKRGQTL